MLILALLAGFHNELYTHFVGYSLGDLSVYADDLIAFAHFKGNEGRVGSPNQLCAGAPLGGGRFSALSGGGGIRRGGGRFTILSSGRRRRRGGRRGRAGSHTEHQQQADQAQQYSAKLHVSQSSSIVRCNYKDQKS